MIAYKITFSITAYDGSWINDWSTYVEGINKWEAIKAARIEMRSSGIAKGHIKVISSIKYYYGTLLADIPISFHFKLRSGEVWIKGSDIKYDEHLGWCILCTRNNITKWFSEQTEVETL